MLCTKLCKYTHTVFRLGFKCHLPQLSSCLLLGLSKNKTKYAWI